MRTQSVAAFGMKAQSAFRGLVLKSELDAKACGFGAFDEMGSKLATRELSYHLFDFARSTKQRSSFENSTAWILPNGPRAPTAAVNISRFPLPAKILT